MRTGIYIKERNIGTGTLALLCSFLNINEPTLNSKLSEEKISLFDKTIDSDDFLEWFLIKLKIAKLEDDRVEGLIKFLRHDSTIEIDDLLAERILNALKFKINKFRYSTGNTKILLAIIGKEVSQLEKIKELKETVLFAKPIILKQPERKIKIPKSPIRKYSIRYDIGDRENNSSYDSDSEEAIMWAIQNGYGDLYGFG